MIPTILAEFPVELLSKIFVQNLPIPNAPPSDIPLSRQPPLQMMLVSHQWRAIALGNPHLWQSLSINHTACHPRAGSHVMKHFSRAGSLPLCLRARLPPGGFLKGWLFGPSWERLVSVDISGDTELRLDAIRMMLDGAPMLVSASFEMDDPNNLRFSMAECPETTLLHLRRLTLKVCCDERSEIAMGVFFETLVLPALEELHLETSNLAYDDGLPMTLVDLQARSQFPLQYLRLTCFEWNNNELIEFIWTIPTLKTLHLQACTTEIHHFCELLHMLRFLHESADNILPNLEQLDVSEVPMVDWQLNDDLLMECFESRWWPNDSSPHKQEGLARLTDVAVRWTAADGNAVAGQIGEQRRSRAESLRVGGMNLVYPTLDFVKSDSSGPESRRPRFPSMAPRAFELPALAFHDTEHVGLS